MRIGELAEQAGMTTKTLRFYEQAQVLPQPARTASGYRDYDETSLARLRFVRAAQGAGLSLAEILGVHAALDGAGDVMLAATYAIKFGLTVDDLADTWAPYLTMSEALRICAGLFSSDMPTSCCA